MENVRIIIIRSHYKDILCFVYLPVLSSDYVVVIDINVLVDVVKVHVQNFVGAGGGQRDQTQENDNLPGEREKI